MTRRQTVPSQWLVADHRMGDSLRRGIRQLPRGSGILLLYRDLPRRERARLLGRVRQLARPGGHLVVDEALGKGMRVHDLRELKRATLRGAQFVFLSPAFPTRSHPERAALPRMTAAAMARLAPVPVIALGGMNARRFRQIARLGFSGWAGIDAYGH